MSKKSSTFAPEFVKNTFFSLFNTDFILYAVMQDNVNILWAECQQVLKDNLPQSAYQTWFAPVTAIQWENNLLVLQVRSQFIVDYIEVNYLDILSRVLRKMFGPTVRLEYRVMMAGSSVDIPSDNLKLQTSSPVAPMVQGFAPIKSDWIIFHVVQDFYSMNLNSLQQFFVYRI